MDIFFVSFNEHNQEINWSQLLKFHPTAIRLHGIKGIDRVHLLCDQLSSTKFYWTVDGDNYLIKKLEYTKEIDVPLIMCMAQDPISKDSTSLGGVKLWTKGSIVNPNMDKGDFCLNATSSKKVVDDIYSITTYNACPYDAWKTSFRHCVKLMSNILSSRPNASNIDRYLNHWKSCQHSSELNSYWCFQGYLDAENFVDKFSYSFQDLNNINNYDWLKTYFHEKYKL